MSAKWNLVFPKEYTQEELMLKSKYEMLRKLKQSVNSRRKTKQESIIPQSGINDKKKYLEASKTEAVKILKKKGELLNLKNIKHEEGKTQNFKKPSSQSKELQSGYKKSAKDGYIPNASTQARSVIVRGEKITPSILRHFFARIGTIRNLRISETFNSGVVTFETPERACMAFSMDGLMTESGQRLCVSSAKKKNQFWEEILAQDKKISNDQILSQKKKTVHVSYSGILSFKDLRQLFCTTGTVKAVYMPERNERQFSEHTKSSGFVTFMREEEAIKAVQLFNGTLWKGMHLTVSPQKVSRDDTLEDTVVAQEDCTRDLIAFNDYV
ncbi:negative elongation factor E-like [Parasteatoda tepidariorum]|uniref:negative elongation factor E-like n=1 Tax=Parasteatoda tepidariorum TaxID=114398 RepID=UPI001C726DF4|nr:uncharacterized protein LOC107455758 [Parasteatoda tepidariorum]